MALRVEKVVKRFGIQSVLNGVDLEVASGELRAIIGPNGAGKSTLFHVISGRTPASGGRITLHGQNIAGLAPERIAQLGLSRSFQITNVFPQLSVEENLRCAALWSVGDRYCFWRGVREKVDEYVREHLALLSMEQRADVPAGLLAYAEQRSLEIGMSIAGNPSVLLLDEPTAGMSQAETEKSVALIKRVSANRTVILIEHDMAVVYGLAQQISVMVGGAIACTGTVSEIRNNPQVREIYLGDLSASC